MILLLCTSEVNAKARGTSKTDGIYSKILSEQRDLLIHLPNSYDQNKSSKYPVIYLTDGLRNFNHASGTLDLLNQSDYAQEMIIVAIKNTHRTRDFTPTYDESYNKWGISGGADNFLDFMEQELIPYVDKTYRTNNFNVLSGHSLGGLLAIYALQSRTNLFQAYFAFSPSLWWHNGVIFKNAENLYTNTNKLNRYLYINMANEGGHMLSSFEKYIKLLQKDSPNGFVYHTDLIKEESHDTSAMVGLNKAYRHINEIFQCPEEVIAQGIPAIEQFYSDLSQTFGASIKADYPTLAKVAGNAYSHKNNVKAVETYQSIVARFPHLSDPYYRLAYIYEADGKYKKALTAIDKALEISLKENVENNKYKSFKTYILTSMKNMLSKNQTVIQNKEQTLSK